MRLFEDLMKVNGILLYINGHNFEYSVWNAARMKFYVILIYWLRMIKMV
jgi:hypothetical protein